MSDIFVRPDVRAFLDYVAAANAPLMHEMEPPAARAQYRSMRHVADLPVGELATIVDLVAPGPAGDIPLRLFDPRASRAPGPAMVYFHGGGFVIGDIDTHAGACAEMARALDLPVISVDYRLAPEGRWPAAPDDCEAAARWVAESPAALGRKVTGLVLAGDSAGGTLTVTATMDLRDRPAAVPVIAHFAIYPATDGGSGYPSFKQFGEGYLLTRQAMAWFSQHYAADLDHVRASPLRGDLGGMPPAVVLTAGLDPIRDQGRAYAAALAQAGVATVFREAAGNIHGFITMRRAIPSSQGDLSAALAALKAVIVEAEGQRVMAQAASTGSGA